MARVKPRLISLDVDDTDRSDEVGKAVITSGKADSNFTSLAAARNGGGRQYALEMTIVQDHASGTLWDLIWTGNGTDISGVYAPYGNADPTADQPHYSFTATVAEPDGDFMGAESSTNPGDVASIEVSWPLLTKPTKVTA